VSVRALFMGSSDFRVGPCIAGLHSGTAVVPLSRAARERAGGEGRPAQERGTSP
jgi:hypothetical protein